MKRTLLALGIALALAGAHAQDAYTETRVGSVVLRDAQGKIARDARAVSAFRKRWACPSTGEHTGACPGWAVDHVIPLACGGRDVVWNMQWLPEAIKWDAGAYSKDTFERRVYGGAGMSKGCP